MKQKWAQQQVLYQSVPPSQLAQLGQINVTDKWANSLVGQLKPDLVRGKLKYTQLLS